MSQEQLYASFLLDKEEGYEIALLAESVTEATTVTSSIRKLPTTVDFLEGIMHLRDAAIPVINLKKRLGLSDTDYGEDAKVAVVTWLDQRYGLLFDDIREVFKANDSSVYPISNGLQTEDKIVTSLIQLEQGSRTIDLLDLDHLFELGDEYDGLKKEWQQGQQHDDVVYSRYIIFMCSGQSYGVPVELAQEITFVSQVDDRYQEDYIDGSLLLRGSSIPVIGAKYLLAGCYEEMHKATEDYRVLVVTLEGCSFGLIVEEVREILSIPDEGVLPIPMKNENIIGVYERDLGDNIILLDMENVISDQIEQFRAKFRLKEYVHHDASENVNPDEMHHLITENGYLVFSIGKHFGMEIKDVQEILDIQHVLKIPGEDGAQTGVVNLRGDVIPVICLRKFLGYPGRNFDSDPCKHIICSAYDAKIALEVDSIVTIYKQEQSYPTPSLDPKWRDKKDVLDRLIEFLCDDGLKEHVLILNIENLLKNHFSFNCVGKVEEEISELSESNSEK